MKSGCIYIPVFLTSALVTGTGQLHVPTNLLPGKQPPYPLYTRLRGRQKRSGRGEKKYLTLVGLDLRPLGHPAHSQSLCRLRYPGIYIFFTGFIALVDPGLFSVS
jgi:hypothetical protein